MSQFPEIRGAGRNLKTGDQAITDYNQKPWVFKEKFLLVTILERMEGVRGTQTGIQYRVKPVRSQDAGRIGVYNYYDADWFEPV